MDVLVFGTHPKTTTIQVDSAGNLIKPLAPDHETGSSMDIENEMRANDSNADQRTNYVQ